MYMLWIALAFTFSTVSASVVVDGIDMDFGGEKHNMHNSGRLRSQKRDVQNHVTSRRLSRTIAYARRRTSNHQLDFMSVTHHARNHFASTHSEDNESWVLDAADDSEEKPPLGIVSLISVPKTLGYLCSDSRHSTSGGREVNILAKAATSFSLVYSDLLCNSRDLAFLKHNDSQSGQSTCLTLSWSTPRLTLEDCYTPDQFKQVSEKGKTQVFRVDRNRGSVIPLKFHAAASDSAYSQDETLQAEDTSQSTIAAVTDEILDTPSQSSPSISSATTFTSTTSSVPSVSSEASTKEYSVCASECATGSFSTIPHHDFLDVYPWRFTEIERTE
ncbi:hypothetical protein V5O48_007680 [Marasmius crinis-equi]|uniref:Ricin B lectin domain-containing protein n=1 Tax=Marasmius crinis-equi TaxID=585013 RepID=A0ABR3FGG6_9AGAR